MLSRAWLPNTLASSRPDTDRVSWLRALIAASDSWVERDTWRRRSPTILVSQKKAGTVTTATMVSCQLRMTMATMVETKMTTLARMLEAVGEATHRTPPPALARPGLVSPACVRGERAR